MLNLNKKKTGAIFGLSLVFALILCVAISFGQVKTSQSQNQITGNGMLQVSPAALGVNALTEPASGTTAASTIIDTTGVRAITLKFSCTQGAVTVNVTTYAEDGATALAVVSPLSAVAAATNADFYAATEQDDQASSGTISSTAHLRFPQKAVSFTFTNASATAGTCTARLLLTF